MAFNVTFYKTSSRLNDLNKSLTQLGNKLACTATGDVSPEKMDLNIDLDAFNLNANYAFVEPFNFYYFVNYKIIGNMVVATLECDPLMSIKADILNADIIAERSTSSYNQYLPDNMRLATENVKLFNTRFPFEFDTSSDGRHYVMILGGV